MRDRTASDERLLCEKRGISLQSEECQDRLVRIDWGNEEGREIRGCLWRVQVRAGNLTSAHGL